MQYQKYFNQKQETRNLILEYLDNENNIEDDNYFNNLIDSYKLQKIGDNSDELRQFLHLISIISNNHHRTPGFFDKFEKIIDHIKNDIKHQFSNINIFNIFQNNKRILLTLFDLKIITPDINIATIMDSETYRSRDYLVYFYPEIKPFLTAKKQIKYQKQVNKINNDPKNPNSFNEKRKIGENETYFCQLIRDDSIEEFVRFVNQSNISLDMKIKNSIFETNFRLLKQKKYPLINYAAFCGAIKIFNYLITNMVRMDSRLWIFTIHSQCSELIFQLENNKIQPPNSLLYELLECHNDDVTNYVQNNYQLENSKSSIFSNSLQCHNFVLFPIDLDKNLKFFYLCQFGYLEMVKTFYEVEKIDVNFKII